MALKPSLSFLRLGSPAAPHVLEIYIDYACPFSAKMVRSLDKTVVPLITDGGALAPSVQLLFRLTPQPWHATSTLMHEAALAVGKLEGGAWWAYTKGLMDGQEAFFDQAVVDLTTTEIRQKLIDLAGPYLPSSIAPDQLKDLLTPKTSPNGGVAVTDDLKFGVKLGRQNGVHVTPTALWDGLIDGSVSSSFGPEEWTAFFRDRGVEGV